MPNIKGNMNWLTLDCGNKDFKEQLADTKRLGKTEIKIVRGVSKMN